jgi:hypothetical protein
MVGIPQTLETRQDWQNAFDYAVSHPEAKPLVRERLRALKNTGTVLVLKAGITKPPEEQGPDDFEPVPDPASSLARSGLSSGEIDGMIAALA